MKRTVIPVAFLGKVEQVFVDVTLSVFLDLSLSPYQLVPGPAVVHLLLVGFGVLDVLITVTTLVRRLVAVGEGSGVPGGVPDPVLVILGPAAVVVVVFGVVVPVHKVVVAAVNVLLLFLILVIVHGLGLEVGWDEVVVSGDLGLDVRSQNIFLVWK